MLRLYTPDLPTKKSIYFWNSFGSVCNAASSFLFLIVVTRILGPVEGGIFSIAFAIAQLMWAVANFEIITFQVTDIDDKFSFNQYHSTKIILFLFSILLGIALSILRGYNSYKITIVILLCIFKGLDAYSAVFFGLFQKKERLDIAGKSTSYRILISIAIFIFCIVFFKNMLIASSAIIVFTVLWILFCDVAIAKKFTLVGFDFNFFKIKQLIIDCFPLFIASYILISIGNQPRYAIDTYYTAVIQNYFGILIMPVAIVNLLSFFILRPLITKLSLFWNNKEYKKLSQIILKVIFYICCITFVCIIGGYFLGPPILSIVFNVDLNAYRMPLCILLLGGGISAIISLLYNFIAIMRKQKMLLLGYIICYIVSILISKPLVKKYEIIGGSVTYLISMIILLFSFILIFMLIFKKSYSQK